MRVLLLITDGSGNDGGIASYNRDFLSAMAASDFTSLVAVLSRFGAVSGDDDKIIHLKTAPYRWGYTARAINAAVKMAPLKIVFCGHLYMVPLAAAIARMCGARLWLQLHGIEAWDRPGILVRKAVEDAYLTTAVSRYTRRRFLTWANVDPENVRVLPNTVDPRFAPGPKPRFLVERFGLEDCKVLLTVSRLAATERYKGHDHVIRALPTVLLRHPKTVYVIVGEGDDRARLNTLVEAVGVGAAVRFVGRVERQELVDYYRLADLFVMPSTGEGFGIVFLEALATGLDVIGSDRDGSVDALAEGRIGTLVDPDDVTGLAHIIAAGLDRKRSPPSVSASASRFALNNFERHVDDLVRSLR